MTTLWNKLGLACVFVLGLSFAPTAHAQNAQLHFVSVVGHGNVSIMEFPCGAIMVDTGGNTESGPGLIQYIDRFFETRPDLERTFETVILTHGHRDHTRNFRAILKRYTVNTLVTNGHDHKIGYRAIHKALRDHPDVEVIVADLENIDKGGLWNETIDPLDCDGKVGGNYPDIRLLWGDATPKLAGWREKVFKDENNHSVTVLVRWGQNTALLTGDLEKPALLELVERQGDLIRDVDVYQISHHGFRSGIVPGFLEHISPRIAILSRFKDRAWYKPTLDRFNAIVRDKRTPADVPIWDFDLVPDQSSQPKRNPDGSKKKRSRSETTGTLTSAIFWPGRDGSTRITFSDSSDIQIEFGERP